MMSNEFKPHHCHHHQSIVLTMSGSDTRILFLQSCTSSNLSLLPFMSIRLPLFLGRPSTYIEKIFLGDTIAAYIRYVQTISNRSLLIYLLWKNFSTIPILAYVGHVQTISNGSIAKCFKSKSPLQPSHSYSSFDNFLNVSIFTSYQGRYQNESLCGIS